MVLVSKITCHKWLMGLLGLATIILLSVFLGITTLKPVEQAEFGVEYNTYTCQFGRVLEQGKYTTDVGVELLKFQRTLQDLRLGTLQCLTKDQVLVTLDVNMQVQYYREMIIPIILHNFENDKAYKSFLAALARSSILDSCLHFSSNDFYSKRSVIDVHMSTQLKTAITYQNAGSSVEFFQLINIAFPRAFSNLILEKQTTQQQEVTLANDRQNAITAAKTRLFVANNTANVKLIQAKQQADSILNQAETSKAVVQSFWSNRGFIYRSVMLSLGFNSSHLVEYINAETIRQGSNSKLVAGLR